MFTVYLYRFIVTFFGVLLKPFKFKGFYLLVKYTNLFIFKKLALVNLDSKNKFVFYINDPYWSLLLSKNYYYEKEVELYIDYLLKLKKNKSNVMFLDLGSNIGYWSLHISKYIAQNNIISVDPNFEVNNIHKLNQHINNLNYQIIEKGIWNKNNEILTLNIDRKNPSAVGTSVSRLGTADKHSKIVETVTIKSIIDKYSDDCIWIIKLDVEGSELFALEFLKNYKKNNVYLIFEDHGKDKDSKVSEYLYNLNFKILYSNKKNELVSLNIDEIKKLKKSSSKGYNFLAYRS